MSPRRHRRAPEPGPVGGHARGGIQSIEDGWYVRGIPGGHSDKAYRCPGCDQEIPPGVAHIVAWPVDGAADERRHWHSPCWRARGRRSPTVRRPRRG
ncbi:MAG TPA: hypothetical protein VE172_16500 [Stackebrandtia sp.]|jgi:hypothetical protein|uniref:hypothetical protein n=1 Tax=Stackebrandtia sp. TaxID=2023065 RepID=UPI002D731A0F|nr:hypothetical protein [Stackebrandtia sp.]HZE40403.1 hypothetical protein [Stackebrandtia sp.]